MWMAVYVRPPRPHVPVVNHSPHRPLTGLAWREIGYVKRARIRVSECESARMNVRPEGVFISRRHLSAKTFKNMPAALLRSKNPFNVMSFQPIIQAIVGGRFSLLASLSCSTMVEIYYMCKYCRCVTCLLYSLYHLGLLNFHFFCCWDAMGINTVLFVAQQSLTPWL